MIKLIDILEKLDPVGKEDADINNDGKVNKTDKYLRNRRKAIAKNIKEGEDHEVAMAQASLKSIISSATQLMSKIGNTERDIPGWIQDHITNAENYIDQAAQGFHELDYDKETYNQIQELFGFGKKETPSSSTPKPSQGFSERFSQVNKETVELAKKVESLIDSNITDSTQKRELKMAILNLTQKIVEEFNR